jgi:putative flippase GtrA
MGAYMGVGVMNLILNGVGMYLVVDVLGIMYLFAQVIVGVVVATETFLVYRYIIFEKNRKWV